MGIQIFWTFFLVVLNGFFVAAEFAIVKVRASQIEIQAKSGSRIANTAKHITQHLDGYLAATQLGITLASLGLGWVGEEVMEHVLRNILVSFGADPAFLESFTKTAAPIIAFTFITILHIVFGELAPKSIAIQKPIAVTMAISLPLHYFYMVFRPFIWLLNGFANLILKLIGVNAIGGHEAAHSSEELQYLLEQSKESGALDSNEHELIKNVFDFNERVVKNIMVPRTKMSAIELTIAPEEVIATVVREGYSRIPVYDETIDKIVGIIHAKDILPIIANRKEMLVSNIIRKPYFIPESKKINDLMAEFQLRRIQIAIVLDEFGGTAGMVTLEDIVEELVGEIQDEFDEEKPIVEKVSDHEFIVNASASIYDVNEHLPHDLPEDEDYDTVGGLVGDLFGKIPEVGERKEFYGYVITIMKKTEQNIESVKLDLVITQEDMVDER
ncbi:hemolysin family protein [Arcticibacter eurypsychrophilus]|uniref:hemolysin family protein n=1 Tax=Arcticibacter eurypsychrophilus TaxID=1434752 RepID=UPI00084D67A3|nr:hemolysin family protein [Arcticibacter eurypsychrophilus]